MNELQIFHNETFGEVRTITRDGEPWFVAADVCAYFGVTNRNRLMQQLDEDEKGGTQMNTPGGMQTVTIVNEAGLYSLLFAMQPTKARGVTDEYIEQRCEQLRAFKRWITHEVIPSIRRNGGYIAGQDSLSDDELIARALVVAQNKIRDRDNLIAKQEQIIGELTPRANYCKMILDNHGLVSITQIAKDYGMSGSKMNRLLAERGIQYKQSGQWLLYSKHHDKGWTHSKTINITRSDGSPDIVMETKWTQLGRLAIYELLKADGILPIIERESA